VVVAGLLFKVQRFVHVVEVFLTFWCVVLLFRVVDNEEVAEATFC
jgi:hypothetical protein